MSQFSDGNPIALLDEARRTISPARPFLPHDQAETADYIQAGADRYDGAERPDAHSAWHWQARPKPGAPSQAHQARRTMPAAPCQAHD